MLEYDRIAGWYVANRSADVGLPDLKSLAGRLPRGARALDLGCGHGIPITGFLLDRGFQVHGLDSSGELLAHYRRHFPGVPTTQERVQDTRFDEASFDAVIAWGLLFHLTEAEQEAAVQSVSHWLLPGGYFLFTSGAARGTRSGEMNGVELRYLSLGAEKYRELVERAGMRLLNDHPDAWDNHVYLCRKLREPA